MLKAGSLLYAIFVTLVVALLTMGILWGHYFGVIQIRQSVKHSQLLANVNSALNKVLVFPDSLPYNKEITFYPFNNGMPVTLKRTVWGMYDMVTARAGVSSDSIKQVVMFGQNAFDTDTLSLYVTDQNKDVYISGNILLKGKCAVPKGQFKYAYITANKLSTKQVFPSSMDKSTKTLPKVNETQLLSNYSILAKGAQNIGRIVDMPTFLSDKDTVKVSFYEPTLILTTTTPYAIRNKTLIGNIMIVSSALVSIESNSKLNKVLVYAPFIRVENKVSGAMQLFASDSLKVGEECKLDFPSTICAFSGNVSFMEIGKNTKMCGNVIQYQFEKQYSLSILKINAGAEIDGFVYSNGYVQPSGKIIGSLYASELYLKTDAGYYENYLVDAELNFTKLSRTYVSCNLFAKKKQRIVSWEY
jgi:hypothetical protein